MINLQTIDRLIQGIQSIVSESRSSLSDEEVYLLEECVDYLQTIKAVEDFGSPSTVVIVSSVIKILLKFLLSEDFDALKDLLF